MSDKIWTKEEIQENLKTKDVWVIKGILAIFDKQTADEQTAETTTHRNNIGFSGADARIMSSFAKQIQSHDKTKFHTPLSQKQIVVARKKIMKYAGQLAKIANKEI